MRRRSRRSNHIGLLDGHHGAANCVAREDAWTAKDGDHAHGDTEPKSVLDAFHRGRNRWGVVGMSWEWHIGRSTVVYASRDMGGHPHVAVVVGCVGLVRRLHGRRVAGHERTADDGRRHRG